MIVSSELTNSLVQLIPPLVSSISQGVWGNSDDESFSRSELTTAYPPLHGNPQPARRI